MGSTLKSFSFGIVKGYSEVPTGVWGLFTEMGNNPSKSVAYVDEILQAGLSGRIDLKSPFYLDAYCKAVEEKTRLATSARLKKVTTYVDTSNGSEKEEKLGYGLVSLNQVSLLARMEDHFEKLIDNDELMYSVSQIKSLNSSFILEYSVNIVETLRNAVRGIPSAVSKLRELCSEFSDIAEYVQVILSSGIDIEECLA